MSNGIRSLPRYQDGGDFPPTGASRVFAGSNRPYADLGYGDVSGRRQRNWEEQNRWTNAASQRPSMFLGQWARDIVGAQIRDRLGWIPGAETVGNWVGAEDITAKDLTRSEYEALQETVLRAMSRGGGDGARTEWPVGYPDYEFAVADPERATNKAFERMFGGYEIDYDFPGWDYKNIRGNREAIDALVGGSGEYGTVSNPHSPPGTQAAAAKGPIIPTNTGLINLSPETYKSARGIAGLIPRFTDPAASVMHTFGRAEIIRDPDTGNYYYKDRYNWNDRLGRAFNPFSREDWGSLREDWGAGEDVYDKARVLSEYFGSRSGEGQEPEGSFVRVNLGPLDDFYLDEAGQFAARPVEDLEQEPEVLAQIQEERPSGLRRGIGWLGERIGGFGERLGDFFDRGGAQVAETSAPPTEIDAAMRRIQELRAEDAATRRIQELRAEAARRSPIVPIHPISQPTNVLPQQR